MTEGGPAGSRPWCGRWGRWRDSSTRTRAGPTWPAPTPCPSAPWGHHRTTTTATPTTGSGTAPNSAPSSGSTLGRRPDRFRRRGGHGCAIARPAPPESWADAARLVVVLDVGSWPAGHRSHADREAWPHRARASTSTRRSRTPCGSAGWLLSTLTRRWHRTACSRGPAASGPSGARRWRAGAGKPCSATLDPAAHRVTDCRVPREFVGTTLEPWLALVHAEHEDVHSFKRNTKRNGGRSSRGRHAVRSVMRAIASLRVKQTAENRQRSRKRTARFAGASGVYACGGIPSRGGLDRRSGSRPLVPGSVQSNMD